MPIYEYECKACKGHAELMMKMSDPAPDKCPLCGGGPLVKLMSRTGFILKGEGWYVTDFRDKKKAPEAAKPEGGVVAEAAKDAKDGKEAKADKVDAPAKTDGPKAEPAKTAEVPKAASPEAKP